MVQDNEVHLNYYSIILWFGKTAKRFFFWFDNGFIDNDIIQEMVDGRL